VPNWFYILVNGLYLLGVAVWIGGSIVLSAVVGPALLRALPRHEAAIVFAPMLRRFARVRVVALVLIIVGAGTKFLVWERNEMVPWMAVRWAAIVLLAWALVVELSRHKPLHALGSNVGPQLPPDDPLRAVHDLLRIRAEGLMRASILPAFIALLFS
jgi:uncharacterized membrane protein